MSRNYMLSFIILVAMLTIAGCKTNDNLKEPKETMMPVEINKSQMPKIELLPYYPSQSISSKVKLLTAVIETEQPKDEFEIFEITAYTSGPESTGKRPGHPEYGINASGYKVKAGKSIACPRSMPFETQIYIEYFDNVFTCDDRGGAITEGHLDVYEPNYKKAMVFGRQQLRVKILKEE